MTRQTAKKKDSALRAKTAARPKAAPAAPAPKAAPSGLSRPPLSAEKQLAGFISKFETPVQRLARAARTALRKRWPTAFELVYDNYNALAIGFGSTEKLKDVIVSLAVYAKGVNLYFMYGASLPDRGNVLQGGGNQGRFVRLQSAATLREPAIAALLRAAAERGSTPLAASGRGRLLIKSISARQRPRRPA